MVSTEEDQYFMRRALIAAKRASLKGEIPIGSVLVCGMESVFITHNQKEHKNDPTAHAEVLALRKGARSLKRWRLGGTLYVTLEPCAMCAGAIILARINRLVFASYDPKAGACGSVLDVIREPKLSHKIEVVSGVLAEESSRLLKLFFHQLRAHRKRA